LDQPSAHTASPTRRLDAHGLEVAGEGASQIENQEPSEAPIVNGNVNFFARLGQNGESYFVGATQGEPWFRRCHDARASLCLL